jgi:16S rRNA processing protein RimM
VRLDPLGGPGDVLRRAAWIFVGPSQLDARGMRVEGVRGHAGRMILKMEGIDDLDAVRRLTGSLAFVRRADFPPAAEGEHYWVDLNGLRACTTEGEVLGVVEEIVGTADFDILVVKDPGARPGAAREHFIPLRADILGGVHVEEGVIIVAPTDAWEVREERERLPRRGARPHRGDKACGFSRRTKRIRARGKKR